MSSDHPRYLTDETTVNKIYSWLKTGDVAAATSYLMNLGDDKAIMKAWIGVQCDINNVRNDPHASEVIAREGVKFALARNYKTGAAMFLHNISAFHMPDFDEGVDPVVIPGIIQASSLQVELREQLEDKSSLAWAHWDHGLALLAGKKTTEAIAALEKSAAVAGSISDRDTVAWANLFIGKSKIVESDAGRVEGEAQMREAYAVIQEVGQDWEKEESAKILASVGIN